VGDYVELGRRIARLRKQRGLTQGGMALALDMTRQGYQNYEMGRTKIPVVELGAIARALRMSRLALLEYLGLVDAAEPNLDDFIRSEAPHLFLLDDAEAPAPLGGWRSRSPIPAESAVTSRPPRPDTFRPQEPTAPPTPERDRIPPGSRAPRAA
jgi:transcriptional regulator with XRE-family HTH domain